MRGDYLAPNGISPDSLAYDPANGDIYVADESANITVLNGTTGAIVDWISDGYDTGLVAAAYDPANHFLYVVAENTNTTSVINTSTNRVVGSIPVGTYPDAVAYDPANGYVYVANIGNPTETSNLTVINGSSNSVVTSVPVGIFPASLTYDAANGFLYVANRGSASVTVVNGTSDAVVGPIDVGSAPVAVAYDAARGAVYVANEISQNVSLIDASKGDVVASIAIGADPVAMTYDAGSGGLYVAVDAPIVSPFQIRYNVTVVNTSEGAVVDRIPLEATALALAVDPTGNRVEVALANDTVLTIDARSNTTLGTLRLGLTPSALAADTVTGAVFVANADADNATVINGSTSRGEGSFAVGYEPYEETFDGSNGELYVATDDLVPVSAVNVSTGLLRTRIQVGYLADGLVYDPANGYIYAAAGGTNNVTIINGSTNGIVGRIPVGSGPRAEAYDGEAGTLYVANYLSRNLTVVDTYTDRVVGSIYLGQVPLSLAYDSAVGTLYVGLGNGSLAVVASSSDASPRFFSVGGFPRAEAYDSANGLLYVANSNGNDVVVVDTATNTTVGSISVGVEPYSVTYDASNQRIYVANYLSGSVSVIQPPSAYPVTFTETGLPSGTVWTVHLPSGAQYSSSSPTLQLNEPNGTYAYSVTSANLDFSAGGGTFTVNGTSRAVSVVFTAVTYQVLFTQTGLPVGGRWWVNLTGGPSLTGATDEILALLPNASYTYSVATNDKRYASPSPETFTVAGEPVDVAVPFALVTYTVRFTETGLPGGTEWWVNLTGVASLSASTDQISVLLSNASYSYAVATIDKSFASSSSGIFTVAGKTVSVPVTFALVTYAVTVTETGLPGGSAWWLNGTALGSHESTTDSLTFVEPNGTYAYTLATPDKRYAGAPHSFSIDGAAVSESAPFGLVTYAVVFTETGLPSGFNWSVLVDGQLHYSTEAILELEEPNGSYSFVVSTEAGYAQNRSMGSVEIHGAGAKVTVGFAPTSKAGGLGALPRTDWYALAGAAGLGGVLLAVGAVLRLRRRRGKSGVATEGGPRAAATPASVGDPSIGKSP